MNRIRKRRKDWSPVCTKCGGERNSSNPKSPWCKTCRAAYMRERYYARQEEQVTYLREQRKAMAPGYVTQLESARRRRRERPEFYRASYRNSRIKKKYGITADDYDALLQSQNGQCLICEAAEQIMYLDHDHQTGAIRGFLCSRCNIGIGQFRDDPVLLANASEYLQRHKRKEQVV